MLEHLDPQHELVAYVKKEHAIGDKACLDCVGHKTKAVYQVFSKILWPRIDRLSGEVLDEGEDDRLTDKRQEDSDNHQEEE
jgi:hypothetical protein